MGAEQYRVYLRGEFGKLIQRADAEAFIAAVGPDLLERAGMPADPTGLSRLFGDQASIDDFVRDLAAGTTVELTNRIDTEWHRNDVANKLARSGWHLRTVSIAHVDVAYAEPRLHDDFRRLGHNLVAIATDRVILADKAYADRAVGTPVAFRTLLAERRVAGRWWVFDGIHRAIQLVRNGETQLAVCAPFLSRQPAHAQAVDK